MDIFQQLHSILRWALLLVLVWAVFKAFMGRMNKSPFTNADDKIGLVLTILADIQLLIGLVLYFMGALGLKNIQNMGMSNVMKNGMARFFAVEHITMMLIAIVLLHIGRAKSKRAATDASKHATSFWFYLIALLLILSSIPWPFRAGFESMRWF